jgi:hypothetical protein
MVTTASKTTTSVQVFLFTECTRTTWWEDNIFSLAFGLVVVIQELLEQASKIQYGYRTYTYLNYTVHSPTIALFNKLGKSLIKSASVGE